MGITKLRAGTRRSWWAAALFIAALFLAACGTDDAAVDEPDSPDPADPADEEEPAEEPTGEEPTELNVAAIFISPVEEPWGTSFLQAWERAVEEQPHGLTLSMDYTESVAPPDAERVLREFASSGQYDIIWAHSSYSDAIEVLREEFPDILWVYAGSGNEPLGGNAYWMDVRIHEPAYLMGIIAGMMTESNTAGAVAAFPFENVNGPLNAFLAGGASVNPDLNLVTTYIESWFDPPTARESAAAQIAAGADFIYAERIGPFEAVADADGSVYAFGHFVDQHDLAPEVVISSAVARWDPALRAVIDAWWSHVTEGVPYDAPAEVMWFPMAEGGAELAPFHELEDEIPAEVREAVDEAEAAILAGELEVPQDPAPLE